MKDSWTSIDDVIKKIKASDVVKVSTAHLQLEYKMSYHMAQSVYFLLVQKGAIHKDGTVQRGGSKWI